MERQSSFTGSFSLRKCGCLLLKILRPSVPMQRQRSEAAFRSQISQALSPHKMPISSMFWHLFSLIIPLIVGCGFSGLVQLLVSGFPPVPRMQFLVDT